MSLIEELKAEESKRELIVVNSEEFGLIELEVAEIKKCFIPVINEMVGLIEEYNDIKDLDYTQDANSKVFKELKQKFVKVRTNTAKIHKASKAYYLAGGKYVDSWKNEQIKFSEKYENDLEEKSKYREMQEKKRLDDLRAKRQQWAITYSEFMPSIDYAVLPSDEFDKLLNGAKLQYESKVKIEEELRIAAELKEKEEREEKDRLNAELKEREELLKKEIEERNRVQKELAKITAELKEKEDLLEKEAQEKEMQEKEELLKKEMQEKENSLLSERQKVVRWLESFSIPDIDIENDFVNSIKKQFDAFKKIAIDSIQL